MRGSHANARDGNRTIETPVLRVKFASARSRGGGRHGGFRPLSRKPTVQGDDSGGEHAPEDLRGLEADQEAVEAVGRAAALEWQSSCGAISG